MDPLEAGEIGESFLSTETARRLSCDAGVVEVIEDAEGMPLSVGRKRRTSSRSVAPVNPPPRGDTRSRNVVVSAAHFLFVPEIVARSDLVALVPARLAHRRTHDLQVFSPPIPVEGFQIAMLWHDRTHEHPGHRWVRDQLAISSSARPAPRGPRDRRGKRREPGKDAR
jgi:DNA-binding transcriptional LysR family regulator